MLVNGTQAVFLLIATSRLPSSHQKIIFLIQEHHDLLLTSLPAVESALEVWKIATS